MLQEVERLPFLQLNKKCFKYTLFVFLLVINNACTQIIKPSIFEPSWMTYDEEKKQVYFELVAAWNANNNGYNFNGYFQDDVTITVPTDWSVGMTLINRDGTAPHSVLVTEPYMSDDIPDELTGEFAVLARAYTDEVYANESLSMRFKAKTGDYWLFCGVKRHAINGMWIKFNVDKNIDIPYIKIKKELENIRR